MSCNDNSTTPLIGCNGSAQSRYPPNLDQLFLSMSITQAILAIVGVIFNLLNIYVLVTLIHKRRGVSPTYHLLLSMGIADFSVLSIFSIFMFSVYTREKPLKFQDLAESHHDYFHILHYLWSFPINIFTIASNWLVVATTVFRFLAVAFPMKVCQW